MLQALTGDWIKSEWAKGTELLNYLKGHRPDYFGVMDQDNFEKEFLTQIDERGIERKVDENGRKTWEVRITEDGKKLLNRIEDPIFRALTQRGKIERSEIENRQSTYGWEALKI